LNGKPADETWVTAVSDQWIKVPSQRVGDGSIPVSVDPQKLSVGNHTGVVTVSSKRNLITPVSVRIRLNILPEATQTQLRIQPAELSFAYERGVLIPATQSLQLSGRPPGETWLIAVSDAWIKVPRQQIGDGAFGVQVDARKLAAGEYSGVVTVSAKKTSVAPVTVTIRLRVTDAGNPPPAITSQLRVVPTSLTFLYKRGGNLPPPQSVQLTVTPPGEAWTAVSDPWIKATPSGGNGDSTISIQVDPQKSSLGPGDHTGTVTLSSQSAVQVDQSL
jgi:hypothetical protein